MCYVKYGVLANIKGEFLVDLTYSELPSLPPKLAAGIPSLSGSAGGLGDMIGLSVDHTQLGFLLPLPIASGVAVLGTTVSVRTWTVWAVLARCGKADHSAPLARKLVENAIASG